MSNQSNIKILEHFLTNRKNLIELFITVIIFGISIELISSGIISLITTKGGLLLLIIGIILCTFAIGYFYIQLVGSRSFDKIIEGFIIINKSNNDIIKDDNYEFLYFFRKHLLSALSEDEALKIDWHNSTFTSSEILKNKGNGKILVTGLTEYFILETLSIHLTDYFNQKNIKEDMLVIFKRDDIPKVLLQNRFLELFTKPMAQRIAFKDIDDSHKRTLIGEKIAIVGKLFDGAYYNNIDFTLPKGSNVTRDRDEFIVITTKRFTLKFKPIFSGYGFVLPYGYTNYYLDIPYDPNLGTFEVKIDIRFNLKPFSLFRKNGWDYYYWVDSLINTLERQISHEHYFKRINWDSIFPIIRMIKKNTNR